MRGRSARLGDGSTQAKAWPTDASHDQETPHLITTELAGPLRKQQGRKHDSTELLSAQQRPSRGPVARCQSGRCEFEAGADTVGDECLGEPVGQLMRRAPPGAVRGQHQVGREGAECFDGGRNDRLEQGAGEVESTDDGVDLLDPG